MQACLSFPAFEKERAPTDPDVRGQRSESGQSTLGSQYPTQPETTGGSAQLISHCPTTAQIAAASPASPTTAPNGKPYLATCPYGVPDPSATEVWGGAIEGGLNWPPMSFDPRTNDLFVCADYTFDREGGPFATAGESATISALNVSSNEARHSQDAWQANAQGGCYSGVLSTAGGLVFVGSRGQPLANATAGVNVAPGKTLSLAPDAKTGKTLFTYPNVTEVDAPAITYSVAGKQYVAISLTTSVVPGYTANATGNSLTVFALP